MGTAPCRILVPVDLTEPSPVALKTGQMLASLMGAEVVLLHVYILPEYTYPGMTSASLVDLRAEVKVAAQQELDHFSRAAGGLRALLREGDPATEILDAIEAEKPTLVVMGTHGRSGISRWLLGSVTERVLRRSAVPVVTVRMHAAEPPESTRPPATG